MKKYLITFYSINGKGESITYKQCGSPIELLVMHNSRQHIYSMAFNRGSLAQKDAMRIDIQELYV